MVSRPFHFLDIVYGIVEFHRVLNVFHLHLFQLGWFSWAAPFLYPLAQPNLRLI
jgi:hypothetical protein